MFVPLNTYSCYSFLRGIKKPDDIVQYAAAQEIKALALTDWGYLTGALEFYQACIDSNIKPIIGLTLPIQYGSPEYNSLGTLVLLAKNHSGWISLCKLSSVLYSNTECLELGAIPFTILSQYAQDLICLTGGKDSLVFSTESDIFSKDFNLLMHRLKELFSENLYVQFPASQSQIKNNNSAKWQAAKRFTLSPVYAPEIFTINPEEMKLHQLIVAIRKNISFDSVSEDDLPLINSSFSDSIKFASDLEELFIDSNSETKLLENTLAIADQCDLTLPLGKPLFPDLSGIGDIPAIEFLRTEAYRGAQKLYTHLTPEIENRLEHELQIIENTGFASLFLIMADVMAYARKADIPTASRGSASSSLIAHCIGITTPDPMRLNLYFERFINPARSTPPDIDTDVCSARRDQLIEYVYKKYGQDQVAMVSTINRFRRRSALRETAKAFGINSSQIKYLVDALPGRRWGPTRVNELADENPYSDLYGQFQQPPYPEIFNLAAQLIDLPHHLSIHPGGVVIAPDTITNLLPTLLASKGILITQFDLNGVEQIGLVKIDLLGIRGLTVLGDMADYVRKDPASESHSLLDVINHIPPDDNITSELVKNGQTIGCFQIESPGMRATLKEIQAKTIDDIMVALALYRPGPMSGGLKDAFIRRHLGIEKVQQLHPALEPLLLDTYGVILYQEQVLRIAHELAGLSLTDADLLRRAMSHFDPGQQMITLRQKFLTGCAQRHNIPKETSQRIWDLMAAFAGYGFPKAHAASYAEVAWRSAWFKSHFPGEFLAAVLANWGGYYSQRIYINEARQLGLVISTPDINYSESEFCSKLIDNKKTLFMGLNQVKDLTRRTQNRILDHRPFYSLEEFIQIVDPRPKEAENLAKAGAFSAFGSEPNILWKLRKGNLHISSRQMSFLPQNEPRHMEDWTPKQRYKAQEEILGICVDHHPLELVSIDFSALNIVTTMDALNQLNSVVKVAGIVYSILKLPNFTTGDIYTFALEDMEGRIQVQIEHQKYRQYQKILRRRAPIVVEGEIRTDDLTGDTYLEAHRIWLL